MSSIIEELEAAVGVGGASDRFERLLRPPPSRFSFLSPRARPFGRRCFFCAGLASSFITPSVSVAACCVAVDRAPPPPPPPPRVPPRVRAPRPRPPPPPPR